MENRNKNFSVLALPLFRSWVLPFLSGFLTEFSLRCNVQNYFMNIFGVCSEQLMQKLLFESFSIPVKYECISISMLYSFNKGNLLCVVFMYINILFFINNNFNDLPISKVNNNYFCTMYLFVFAKIVDTKYIIIIIELITQLFF